MSSPLNDLPGHGLPPYEKPAWYTDPLTADDPDSLIPWHTAGAPPTPEPGCHVCTAHPVVCTEIRSHTGLILWSQTHRIRKHLCRQCGISLVRTMTTRTLWQGWWGIFSLLARTPTVLAQNAAAYHQLRKLSASEAPPGRSSLAPGKPLLRRPQAYVALIPVAGAAALFTHLIQH